MRYLNWFYIIVGQIPILFISLLTIRYFKAALEIGHLPTYNNPDSGQFYLFLPHGDTYSIVLFIISGWGILILPVLFTIHFITSKKLAKFPSLTFKNFVFGYYGYLLLTLFIAVPGLNVIFNWYID